MPPTRFQKASVRHRGLPVTAWTTSNTSAVTQRPIGNTTSIGWMGCLAIRARVCAMEATSVALAVTRRIPCASEALQRGYPARHVVRARARRRAHAGRTACGGQGPRARPLAARDHLLDAGAGARRVAGL